jgi:hypothetical protein
MMFTRGNACGRSPSALDGRIYGWHSVVERLVLGSDAYAVWRQSGISYFQMDERFAGNTFGGSAHCHNLTDGGFAERFYIQTGHYVGHLQFGQWQHGSVGKK